MHSCCDCLSNTLVCVCQMLHIDGVKKGEVEPRGCVRVASLQFVKHQLYQADGERFICSLYPAKKKPESGAFIWSQFDFF